MLSKEEFDNFGKTKMDMMNLLVRLVGLNCHLISFKVEDYTITFIYTAQVKCTMSRENRWKDTKTETRTQTYNYFDDMIKRNQEIPDVQMQNL